MGFRDRSDGDEPTATRFNAAIASLERLHQLLNDCNEYSRLAHSNGYNYEYLKQWRYSIVDVLRELSPKLNNDENKEIKNKFQKFKKINPIISSRNTPEGKVRCIDSDSFRRQWSLLHNIEIYLRKCADKRKMLIPDSDELPGDALT